jgi:hypothetical protein
MSSRLIDEQPEVNELSKTNTVRHLERQSQQPVDKDVSQMRAAELALLEKVKSVFVRKLRNQFGPWLENHNSVHVQVRDLAGQRIVSFSANSPGNKGVVVFLDEDLARVRRIDVHASQLRRLDVDWASLLLPFGQRWGSLNLRVKRDRATALLSQA